MQIEIVKAGLLTTLQDGGRVGYAHLGVGRAGGFDLPSLRLANALVGNPAGACTLEVTLAGPSLRMHEAAWIAVTGAPTPVTINGVAARGWAPLPVPAGALVAIGTARIGCRSYLAVHGGFDVDPVLESRSTDLNAALGPIGGRALRAGDVLPTGCTLADLPPQRRTWSLDPRTWFDAGPERTLRLIPGAHFESLSSQSQSSLFLRAFKITSESNRAGLRLAGEPLALEAPAELVSEGCVPGLLQLPPSGQPIIFGPEGPVSGGYPRIGQIAAIDLPRLAQSRPGDAVRFVRCTLDAAARALANRERSLERLTAAIHKRLRAH